MEPGGKRWAQYNRVLSHTNLMDQVMEKLNVDMSTAVRINNGYTFHLARKKCIGCVHVNQCRQWLENPDACNTKAPQCPNADFFNQCTLPAEKI
ncbi:MAG: DUF6455 family protein [Methyloligellaceae bacterium]